MFKSAGSILLVALAVNAAPPPAWETGNLVHMSTETIQTGAPPNQIGPFSTTIADYTLIRHYVIRAGDREFTIAERPSTYTLRDNPPHVVVNTAIRFRIEKKRMIFLDADGKEHKAELERETPLKP